MLEVPKTKLKIIAYRLRDAEKILTRYCESTYITKDTSWAKDIRLTEMKLIIRQASQDLLNLIEGTDLEDVEKEIERLQRSLTS